MIDGDKLLSDVLKGMKIALEEKKAVVFCEKFPDVQGDEIQFGQLLQNLIGNAIKYCKKPPEVTISAERGAGNWLVCVSDNGIGVPADQLESIFEPMQRGSSVDDFEGTGLGLAICRTIVERHRGRLWCESIVNEGSKFYFILPAHV